MRNILFLCVSLLAAGCASTSSVRESDAAFQLFVDVTPRDAVILVDDAVAGSGAHSAEVPLRVAAGPRRIARVADGYYPFKTTLEYIQPGETYTLKTTLIPSEF